MRNKKLVFGTFLIVLGLLSFIISHLFHAIDVVMDAYNARMDFMTGFFNKEFPHITVNCFGISISDITIFVDITLYIGIVCFLISSILLISEYFNRELL